MPDTGFPIFISTKGARESLALELQEALDDWGFDTVFLPRRVDLRPVLDKSRAAVFIIDQSICDEEGLSAFAVEYRSVSTHGMRSGRIEGEAKSSYRVITIILPSENEGACIPGGLVNPKYAKGINEAAKLISPP